MDDIAKCKGDLKNGKKCPLRDICYRFNSQNEPGQMYFWYMEAPYDEEKQYCEQFIEDKD